MTGSAKTGSKTVYKELVKMMCEASPFQPMSKGEQDDIMKNIYKADPIKAGKVNLLLEKGEKAIEDHVILFPDHRRSEYHQLWFDIKMHGIRVPKEVSAFSNENGLDDSLEDNYRHGLEDSLESFMEDLMEKYPWFINQWSVDGRSGGWLVMDVESGRESMNKIKEIKEDFDAPNLYDFINMDAFLDMAIEELPIAIDNLARMSAAIVDITRAVEEGKKAVKDGMSSIDYWHDWMVDNGYEGKNV